MLKELEHRTHTNRLGRFTFETWTHLTKCECLHFISMHVILSPLVEMERNGAIHLFLNWVSSAGQMSQAVPI